MSKDWTGNSRSAYAVLGARNFAKEDREKYDYYATEPKATEELLKLENFSHYIWEPAAGEGHIAEVLKSHNYDVVTNDIIERNYPLDGEMDFFNVTKENMSNTVPRDIITNPPYKYAKEFVEHALDISMNGTKVAMFLKIQFLASKSRGELFEKYPPKTIWVSRSRLQCAKNGDFDTYKKGTSTAIAYAWFVWVKGFKGKPTVGWFN